MQSNSLTPQEWQEIARKYGLKRVALFGSRQRGDHTPNSDTDILVQWDRSQSMSINRLLGCKEELEKKLNTKVDLVSEDSLHWYLKDRILSEAKDML